MLDLKFKIYNLKFRRKLVATGFSLVALIVIFAIFARLTVPPAAAAWFDDSWEYRKNTNIASHTSAENNVYVTIPAFDATDTTRYQSDCGNLRFTDAGGKLLQFFAVDCDATANINVFFDTLPAGSSNYYMYYGNLNAPNGFASANFSTAAINLGSQTAASEETTPGPISYWRFDEAQGNANDSTPQSNTLTVTNAVWKVSDLCAIGNCLFFDGTTDYAAKTYSTDTELNPGTASFSVSLWFKHSSTTPSSNQFALARFLSGGYKIYMNTSGNMCFGIDSDATWTPSDTACGTSNLADSTWHYLTAVKSGTSTITLYIDGQRANQTAVTDVSSLSGSSPVMNVGIDTGQASGGWVGFLDEVKYSNFAKTAANVQTEFASRGTSKGVSASFGPDTAKSLSTGLVGYWKLDEASGNATDSSGNSLTGTATGTTVVTGQFGNARSFSGTDQISTGSVSNVYSVAFWINPTSTTTDIIRLSTSPATNISATSGALSAPGFTNPAIYINGARNGALIANTWQHVVVTSTAAITADGLLLGRVSTALAGSLDDIRIYNRALSPAEVAALYNFAPGPVGHWKLDENTGTTANDSSGNNNSATLTNSPTWSVGKYGPGVSFAGGDQQITRADDTDFDFDDDANLTLETWFRHTTASAQEIIMSKYNEAGYKIIMESDGDLTCALDYDGTWTPTDSATSTAATYDDNLWHHIACAKTGATSLDLYIDGVLIATDSTISATNTLTNSDPIYFGIDADGTSNDFLGSLDDIKIYNYPRTPKQIIEDMNAGHPAPGSPVGSHIAHWTLDEGDTDTLNDSSVNNNDGDLAGPITNCQSGSNANCPTWTTDGKFNKALDFNGSAADAQVTDANLFSFGNGTSDNPFSLSVWINADTFAATGNVNGVLSKRNGTDDEWALYLTNSGRVLFDLYDDSAGTRIGRSYSTVLTASTWYHIVTTYNASESSSGMRIYVNGIRVDNSDDNSGSYTAMENLTSPVFIGETAIVGTSNFDGRIDDIRIYNSELNSDEVRLLSNQASSAVLGSVSTTSGGAGDWSARRSYCPPGNTESNCAAGQNPSPAGEWLMDDNTGLGVADTSGNDNTANFTNMEGDEWRPGKIGSSIYFNNDGTNERANAGSNTSIDLNSSFTVTAWVNPSNIAGNTSHDVVDKSSGGTTNGWIFRVLGTLATCGSVRGTVIVRDPDASSSTLCSTTVLSNNIWYHIAFTNDGTTTIIYINGVRDTSGSQTFTSGDANSLLIGGNTGFIGNIDTVRIYPYVLTPAQIAWDYNRGGPVAHYKFDECQGTTAYNSAATPSAQLLNGTINARSLGNTAVGDCPTSGSTMWFNGATGKYNSSLDFDSSDDDVSVANNDVIWLNKGLQNGLTISAWIYPNTSGESSAGQIFSKGSATYCQTTGSTPFNLVCSLDLGTDATLTVNSVLPANTWSNVVMSWTDDADDEITLWVNGRPVGSSGDGVGPTSVENNSLIIGNNSGQTATFDGQIDDFKVFSYEMTAAQTQGLYNESSAIRFGPQTGNP